MKLARAEILPYVTRLTEPLHNARRDWPAREGLLLRLFDASGRVGQGEASPLPGHSPDTISDCRAALERAEFHGLPDFDLEHVLVDLIRVGDLVGDDVPAARCALETAFLDLAGQQRSEPAWAMLRSNFRTAAAVPSLLPLSALLDAPDPRAWLEQAKRALARGIHTFKVKIGRIGQFEEELQALKCLREQLGHGLRVRLDVNRAWSVDQSRAYLPSLLELDPEYVEEPCDNLLELGSSPVPLALDESLLERDALERFRTRGRALHVVACVMKPMLLGGVTRPLALARQAHELGLDIVLSHTFDGPIGLALSAALALAVATPDRAAGLDRHAALRGWPGVPIAAISAAHVVRTNAPGLGMPLLAAPTP